MKHTQAIIKPTHNLMNSDLDAFRKSFTDPEKIAALSTVFPTVKEARATMRRLFKPSRGRDGFSSGFQVVELALFPLAKPLFS